MERSKIEWTEATWNPIAGCNRVSPGCLNCYAERMARRLQAMGKKKYQGTVDKNGRWTGRINFNPDALNAPLKRKKPTTYFVNSMSDLFHENITLEQQTDIFEVIARAHWHTFQVLTKRPEQAVTRWRDIATGVAYRLGEQKTPGFWPLKNIWFGISVENQQTADKRIPELLKIPAKIRFLSCEPLLEPIDLEDLAYEAAGPEWAGYNPLVDWVIIGGESGPRARPFDLAWAESIVAQCAAAGIPVFVKQLGSKPIDGLNGQKSGYPVTGKGGDMAEWPKALRVREYPIREVV